MKSVMHKSLRLVHNFKTTLIGCSVYARVKLHYNSGLPPVLMCARNCCVSFSLTASAALLSFFLAHEY